jgi:transposase
MLDSMTKEAIAKEVGVGVATVYRVKNELSLG